MGKSEVYEGMNSRTSGNNKRPMSPKNHLENEKRLRREIANSNERRRMQSINSGFQSLKTLLPLDDGEKLSKAAILQQTSDYITSMEQEKTRLLSQNAHLKRMLAELSRNAELSPPPKRKKRDTESSDEGIGMSTGDFEEPTVEEIKREMIELRTQLDRERRLRMMLEEQTRQLESQLYPERLRNLATQVQAQMKYQEEKQRYLDEQREIEEEKEKRLSSSSAPSSLSPQQRSTPVSSTTTASPTTPFMNPTASSMSRRNLETIVEAIRHLEGDSVLLDNVKIENDRKELIMSDSDGDSCMASDHEMECCKPEPSYGRLSPPPPLRLAEAPSSSPTTTATIHVDSHIVSTEKYPIATQLLHRPASLPQSFLPQRPGVIVHNLS